MVHISLDVENTKEYKEAERTIDILEILIQYYSTDMNFDELELGKYNVRDFLAFMTDNGLPKRQFIRDRTKIISQLKEEIKRIKQDLKNIRLKEIKDKNLRSLVVIPSWGDFIGKNVLGFYLNRPVIDIRKHTVVMLNRELDVVHDKLGKPYTIIAGPGIFYTEFSLDPGNYITDIRPINMIIIPTKRTEIVLNADPIFDGELEDATLNEKLAIVPFDLIEAPFSVQAFLRGVISRNVFHPNKNALDAFTEAMHNPESFKVDEGYYVLSGHEEYNNRLLISKASTHVNEPHQATAPGLTSVINGKKLLDEIIPDKKKQEMLLVQVRSIKKEYTSTGEKLLRDWIP